MTVTPLQPPALSQTTAPQTPANTAIQDETAVKFEKLLWAELLTHTGLEDALTLGGGQGASMFSRYFVEAIAGDIAEQHPLGLLSAKGPLTETAKPNVELKA